jgi:hypothetical protein
MHVSATAAGGPPAAVVPALQVSPAPAALTVSVICAPHGPARGQAQCAVWQVLRAAAPLAGAGYDRLQAGLRALVEQSIADLANAWALRRWRGRLYRIRDVYRAAGGWCA